MPLKAPDALDVKQITDFLYTSTAYTGKTDQEKRRLIKTKLDSYNFAINTSAVSQAALLAVLGEEAETPDEVQGAAITEGVAWVNAHYDGTTKTAVIKQGQPVCLDMTTAKCVTGVDASWGADEYKVIGTALKDYSTVNVIGQIPIRLVPPVITPPVVLGDYAIARMTTGFPACPWYNNGFTPAELQPAAPEWIESTGYIFLPQKKDNGKYAYSPLATLQKILNFLPFTGASPSPGDTGEYYVTPFDGAWIIKRPVSAQWQFSADAHGGALSGSGRVVWQINNFGTNIGSVAALDALTSDNTTIKFPATLLCEVHATVTISCLFGDVAGPRWRSSAALNLASVPSTFDHAINGYSGTPFGGPFIETHHLYWSGYLQFGQSVYVTVTAFGPTPTVLSGNLTIRPLIQQP